MTTAPPTGGTGIGGVSLSTRTYPLVPAAVLRGLKVRADSGRLDTTDVQNADSFRTGDLGRTYTIGRRTVRLRWRTRYGTGVREDGERAPLVFDRPGFSSGVRQLDDSMDRRLGGEANAYALVAKWSDENAQAARQYAAAVRDAREQAMDNAAARAEFERNRPETPEERAARVREEERQATLRRLRTERIFGAIQSSTGREGARLRARLAKIEEVAGLGRAYAARLDAGEDPVAAAAETVPDPETVVDDEAEDVSPIDRLYPLEEQAYYVETFAALGPEWGALYLGFTDQADLPLAAPDFYVSTFDTLPPPWRNLYNQALLEM
jgi:hypothetical protein